MVPFLHGRLQTLTGLLESSNAALRAYNAADLDTAGIVAAHLGQASTGYRTLGLVDAENDILALSAQFASARRGWHPLTLERVTTRRRETERSIALRVLNLSAERLRADLAVVQGSLQETRERLTPIVLYALQKGSLSPDPHDQLTHPELQAAWESLQTDPHVQTAARQVAMSVSVADITLTLAALLSCVGD